MSLEVYCYEIRKFHEKRPYDRGPSPSKHGRRFRGSFISGNGQVRSGRGVVSTKCLPLNLGPNIVTLIFRLDGTYIDTYYIY